MTTTETFGNLALEFDSLLDELKSAAMPDKEKIAQARSTIDAAADAQQITVREWRRLIEKGAQIRRTNRVCRGS